MGKLKVLCAEVKDESEVWKKSSLKLLAAYQDPPTAHLSMKYVARKAEEREYVHRQFQRCQEQVGMDPNMLFFSETYEPDFVKFMNKINVARVRITFTIGGCASALLFWYEADRLQLYDSSTRDISIEAEHALYFLTIGIVLVFFAGVGLSFTPYMQQRLERLGFGVYWLVATAFITKKWVQQQLGPVLPLVILLIPVFNVTRMRFAYNCVLGWYIVITYFIVQLVAGPDETSAIVFQSLNYSMSVISGMVSSYQREILKRRNFTLGLPLQGTVSDVVSLIHDRHYLKEYLCHPISQQFRCDDLERYFYRFWYLLDRSPYENPNAGILHLGVYKGIKFATIGVVVNQITLSLQDVLNLYGNTMMKYTISIRYCLIVPAYALQFCLFYYYGQLYANLWRKKREVKPEITQKSPTRVLKQVVDKPEDTGTLSVVAKTKAVINQTKVEIGQRAFEVVDLQQEVVNKVTKSIKQQVVKEKEGYTRSAQFTTLSVFLFHVSLNGFIFFLIASAVGVKSVYFMGFLNSLMSAHRSGFRLRFMFSSLGTTALSTAFIISLYNLAYTRFTEYTSYVLVIQVLGIIISYEEENLRRSFFIKKTIRLMEFQSWCAVNVLLPHWIKARMRQLCSDAKARVAARNQPPQENTDRASPLRSSIVGLKYAVANPLAMVTALPSAVSNINPLAMVTALPTTVSNVNPLAMVTAIPSAVSNLNPLAMMSALPSTMNINYLASELDMSKNLRDLQAHLNKSNKVVSNASDKYSQASRYGVYANSVNVLIAAGQVAFFIAKH